MKPKTYLIKRIRELESELNSIVVTMETNRKFIQAGQMNKVDINDFHNKLTKTLGLKMAIAELTKVRKVL